MKNNYRYLSLFLFFFTIKIKDSTIFIKYIKMYWKSLEDKQKERLANFFSGLVAGVISVTVCNPLDIARTRLNVMVNISTIQNSPTHQNNRLYTGFLHTMQTMWKQEGLKGFYTGTSHFSFRILNQCKSNSSISLNILSHLRRYEIVVQKKTVSKMEIIFTFNHSGWRHM